MNDCGCKCSGVPGQRGPQGIQGIQGVPGPQGEPASEIYFRRESSQTAILPQVISPLFVSPALSFGGDQALIQITTPGRYRVEATVSIIANNISTLGGNGLHVGVRRENNTPIDVIPFYTVGGISEPRSNYNKYEVVVYTFPFIYVAENADDILNIHAGYSGSLNQGNFLAERGILMATRIANL